MRSEYQKERSDSRSSESGEMVLSPPPDYYTAVKQEITHYTYDSSEADNGLDRFGRPVKYKAERYDEYEYYKGHAVRKTWAYNVLSVSLSWERFFRKQTIADDEIETVKKHHIYNSYGALNQLDLEYREYPTADYPLTNHYQYWTHDGADNWICYSEDNFDPECMCGQNETTRGYDGRCEISWITGGTISYNEVGLVKEYNHPEPGHGVDDKELFYDAWGRLVEIQKEGNIEIQFEYDALGHKIIHFQFGYNPDFPMHYYYDIDWNRAYWCRYDFEGTVDFSRAEFTSSFSGRPLGIQDEEGSPEPLKGYLVDPYDKSCGLTEDVGTLDTLYFKKTFHGEPVAQPKDGDGYSEPEDPYPDEYEKGVEGYIKKGGAGTFVKVEEDECEDGECIVDVYHRGRIRGDSVKLGLYGYYGAGRKKPYKTIDLDIAEKFNKKELNEDQKKLINKALRKPTIEEELFNSIYDVKGVLKDVIKDVLLKKIGRKVFRKVAGAALSQLQTLSSLANEVNRWFGAGYGISAKRNYHSNVKVCKNGKYESKKQLTEGVTNKRKIVTAFEEIAGIETEGGRELLHLWLEANLLPLLFDDKGWDNAFEKKFKKECSDCKPPIDFKYGKAAKTVDMKTIFK